MAAKANAPFIMDQVKNKTQLLNVNEITKYNGECFSTISTLALIPFIYNIDLLVKIVCCKS